jgi:hypothetical protein
VALLTLTLLPVAHLTDQELEQDVTRWAHNFLPIVDPQKLLRGARVAKDIRMYDEVARCPDAAFGADLQVILTAEERNALRREKDVTFSEKGMYIVILTVSLASFLQGSFSTCVWIVKRQCNADSVLDRLRPILIQRRDAVQVPVWPRQL